MHMDLEGQITEPVWLTHFSEEAFSIAWKGLTHGMADPEKLGLTTYFKKDSFEKGSGGYNFAFLSDSKEAQWSAHKAWPN